MRLNKFLSHNAGVSRRQADELIKSGAVRLNGRVEERIWAEVGADDKVALNGRAIKRRSDFTAIVYHKDKGELVARTDARGRKTIYHVLPTRLRHFRPVGRLDFASSGLLLLTDSPSVADFLMRADLEREYYLKVRGEVGERVQQAMREGLQIRGCTKGAHALSKTCDMDIAAFLDYEILGASGGYTKLRVIIAEGQNRELRRFFGYFDLEVVDLKRVAFGRMELGTLKPGKWRYFERGEYEDLRDFLAQNGVRY